MKEDNTVINNLHNLLVCCTQIYQRRSSVELPASDEDISNHIYLCIG